MEIESDDDAKVVLPSLKEMIDMYRTIEETNMSICTEGALDLVMAAH